MAQEKLRYCVTASDRLSREDVHEREPLTRSRDV